MGTGVALLDPVQTEVESTWTGVGSILPNDSHEIQYDLSEVGSNLAQTRHLGHCRDSVQVSSSRQTQFLFPEQELTSLLL